MEAKIGPRLKEKGVLPNYRHSGILNIRSDLSFPAVRPPSPKRPREEGGGEELPAQSQPRASKRTRVH